MRTHPIGRPILGKYFTFMVSPKPRLHFSK